MSSMLLHAPRRASGVLLAIPALCIAASAARATPVRAPAHDAALGSVPASRAVTPLRLERALAARGIPSFSRQTGMACSACHYQFPQLTPFGRLFKLNGYTLTGLTPIVARDSSRETLKLSPIPLLATMVQASLTHTRTAPPGTQNDATAFPQQLSFFLGGELAPKLGTFTQFTYSGADGSFGIDNAELRFASRATIASHELVYGLTLNNNPTVEDLWNTTPAWGFPFASSDAAPSPAASTLIDGGLGQQVVGVSAYGMWNKLLYVNVAAYHSAPQGVAQPLDSTATGANRGIIPYWRVALQHEFGPDYLMVGSYGLTARLYPAGITGPTDHLTNVAFDAQYEHKLGATGALIGRTTWIHESQRLDALVDASPPAANPGSHTLETFRINASYAAGVRYGATLGYFTTTGTADTLLYAPAPVTGSVTGRPNSDGVIGELDFNPWQNARLAFQYVHYGKFNGASSGYDGAGRSASSNDTAYFLVWLAF